MNYLKYFILLANQGITRIDDRHIAIEYFPFPGEFQSRNPQNSAFPDSSPGALSGSSCIESYCAFLCRSLERDGAALRKANLIFLYGRRYARVCASTAHSEGIPLSRDADCAAYLQCACGRSYDWEFCIRFIRGSESLPMTNPIRHYPSAQTLRNEIQKLARETPKEEAAFTEYFVLPSRRNFGQSVQGSNLYIERRLNAISQALDTKFPKKQYVRDH